MYVRKNMLKEKVTNGETVTGMELWLRDPRMIELMGHAGFDFVHIENEHVAHDWEAVEDLIRTAESVGLTPLFRCEQSIDGQPPVNQIIKALKCGAQIIMVPHVETPEQVKKIVNAAKYPPIGKRGFATCDRGAMEIFTEIAPIDMQKFIQEANEQTMLWAIIESPRGVANIDAILDVDDGIDVVGFGHEDYAIGAGLSSASGPEIDEAREKVREAALRKGKLMWWNTHDPEIVQEQRKKGIQMFLIGADIVHINSFLRNLIKTIRK